MKIHWMTVDWTTFVPAILPAIAGLASAVAVIILGVKQNGLAKRQGEYVRAQLRMQQSDKLEGMMTALTLLREYYRYIELMLSFCIVEGTIQPLLEFDVQSEKYVKIATGRLTGLMVGEIQNDLDVLKNLQSLRRSTTDEKMLEYIGAAKERLQKTMSAIDSMLEMTKTAANSI